jgi:transcriptional regulator with XRE-family HTH domain
MSGASWSNWQAQCHHFGVATDRLRRLAAAIRRRRLELGLTQEHVAYESGTSVRNYSRIEAGTVNVRSLTLYELATVLETTPASLFDAADDLNRRRKA